MNIRILLSAAMALVLGACNQVTGQKDRGKVVLKTSADSISYAIGNDVGNRLRAQLREVDFLDTLNLDLLASGVRTGLDSIPSDSLVNRALVNFQLAMQARFKQRQQVQAEESLRKGEAWLTENGKKPGVTTTASGLQYEVVQQGTGPKPKAEDVVDVHYRGTLVDGKEFDSSYKRGQPATFGLGQVIPGWTEGLQLMPVGSKYKLYIPSNLGYGAQGMGQDIPPYSVLVFDVELLAIKPEGTR
jgi:FKBP-type peptidyl-prolyl cis-trans isomerase